MTKYRISTCAGYMRPSQGPEYQYTVPEFQKFAAWFFCGTGPVEYATMAEGKILIANAITHKPVVLEPVTT